MMFKTIAGILLIIIGIFDAYKYTFQAKKIIRVKSAKSQSRKFINISILNNLTRITYCIVIQDVYLILVSVLALFCMLYLFYVTYRYYPYRRRGLNGFKRPNLLLYSINSMLPNKIRKRL